MSSSAESRAGIYHLLALVFDYPVPELHQILADGSFREKLWEFQDALGMPRTPLPLVADDLATFQADYIALFDIGRNGGAPCALNESAYLESAPCQGMPRAGGSRTWLFQELLRFYHHFGLHMTENPEERVLPDHLVCQLEMMAFLCHRESRALLDGTEPHAFRQAQEDFIDRHLGCWTPKMIAALNREEDESGHFFGQAGAVLGELVAGRVSVVSRQAD